MWDEIQDAPGEIFDIAARDAALDSLIEDALFDADETTICLLYTSDAADE